MTFEEAAAISDGFSQGVGGLRNANVGRGDAAPRLRRLGLVRHRGRAARQAYFGAHVTAVCNTKNVELVRSLGADEVIDYLKEDFTKNGKTYDIVLDAVGKHSFLRSRRALAGRPLRRDGPPLQLPACAPDPVLGTRKVVVRLLGRPRRTSFCSEGAHRSREVPGGHRPHVPARRRRRGDEVRRELAEDRQRRPHGSTAGEPR